MVASSSSSSLQEFQQLEQTLPPPIQSSSTKIFQQFELSSPSPENAQQKLSSKNPLARLQQLRNEECHSPIPTPGPIHPPDVHYPALNKENAATGVIWCTDRASERGYPHVGDWVNLGQGMPETGDVPGCFKRPIEMKMSLDSREYGPTSGIKELRQAVADLYNDHFRQGKESKYTWENVNIAPGGRAALTRIAAILGDAYLSFFLPDYTAYAEMLSLFKNFAPIPVPLYETDGYKIDLKIIKGELNRGVSAILTSNPRNPTGQCLTREELHKLHKMCREKCLLIMDEFYTRYYYDGEVGECISSASEVEDVNKDPVLIIDGLTKFFRLPGWRISWVVGPKQYISALSSAGSYLDGGANYPFQEAAVSFLKPDLVKQETIALQLHFKAKRDYCLDRLIKMGFKFKVKPNSTFYIWVDLSHLPGKLSNCLGFFHEALHEEVIVVPGIFFDLNPLSFRELSDSEMYSYVRISYGPDMESMVKGMDRIENVLRKHGALPAGYTS
ncbi:pyridoxal phosphate-dependent aminotransferase [Cyberlindnera jadinii NRRL Y-1542]|uniref:Aminotransferase n=1 Tax=Cyberlindnera jadinii (strain ATCC 18201 / CBS 1600 / BCRC 20928 / JCM 3617 / NBRC 0987 / NRRL Y-1542) TaxID=983966 RepID=A0A1E4S1G8_CYBJN|nr:aminotransferase [Cyberlindnera jadinii NRRL Y-1542]ODV73346.1 aminotransferase [Cyberlindnera jadinii NRRL Y-1542]